MSTEPNLKSANWGILAAGYTFSLLGGLTGLAIAVHLRNAKVSTAEGAKVPMYDANSRKHGTIMCCIAGPMILAGLALQLML